MSWLYLVSLLVPLVCMVVLDHRFGLFLFADARRGALVLAVGIAVFVGWDLAAIALGFYGRGQGEALSGVEILPHLPVEELVFITFLCYLTMVLHGLVARFVVHAPEASARAPQTRADGAGRGGEAPAGAERPAGGAA